MIKGFLVKIRERDEEKNLKIYSPILTLGNEYKSGIHVNEIKKTISFAEHREKSLLINMIEGVDIKIYQNNRVFFLSEIKDIFPDKGFVELNKNVTCEFEIGGKRVIFKPEYLKEEKREKVKNRFQKSFVTKENIKFIMLFLFVATILYAFALYSVANFKPVKKIAKLEEGPKEIEINYKEVEKQAKEKKSDSKEGAEGGGKGEKSGSKPKEKSKSDSNVSNIPTSTQGTFFEGPAVVKEGVLGVKEGAKTVIIQKERSLFSKIDETLEAVPVKGAGETSDKARKIEDFASQKYETVKAESIYKGPEQKEIKAELAEGKSIQASIQKESDIRILKGKRPENEILSVVSRYKKGFEFLFIDARKKDPNLEGKVVVFFVISESGAVTKAEIAETTIKNDEFLNKILNLVKSIKFPKSDVGDTGVKIPLLFFPQG